MHVRQGLCGVVGLERGTTSKNSRMSSTNCTQRAFVSDKDRIACIAGGWWRQVFLFRECLGYLVDVHGFSWESYVSSLCIRIWIWIRFIIPILGQVSRSSRSKRTGLRAFGGFFMALIGDHERLLVFDESTQRQVQGETRWITRLVIWSMATSVANSLAKIRRPGLDLRSFT